MPLNREKLAVGKFWAMPAEKVIELLETSEEGLSEREAVNRLAYFGRNILPKKRRGLKIRILLRQFKSPLIIILLVAGVITLFLKDFKDSGFIFSAVLVNAVLGFYQENKAATALKSLETYIKERVRVIRDGKEREIDAEEIVPGDIIRLVSGARVPADARLIVVNELFVDEAILTGESLPVLKTTDPVREKATVADQESLVFSGTLISGGVGLAVVVKTGAETELGRIAAMVSEKEKDQTPLQVAITKFSLRVGVILFLLASALFLVGVSSGYAIFDMFLISVAVAVSAVPEGLPIALTVILAVGVERLAKHKGIVRKLLAAEALGSTTLVLTDK
ncbi:MAG: HAD-IC family P-type ATPase, partial [Patescibacteria group bacterium]